MTRGRFITFEGGEGAGKSTQIRMLAQRLTGSGHKIIQTREPGGSPSAEEIRKLLVTGAPDRWSPLSETLLFYAARVEHWSQTIAPALEQGQHVLCDRFADSTIAYQVYAGGLDKQIVDAIHQLTMKASEPDLTLIFDLPVEIGLQRAHARKDQEGRFESKPQAYHERLRQGFLQIAKDHAQRCVVINAAQSIDHCHTAVVSAVQTRLGLS